MTLSSKPTGYVVYQITTDNPLFGVVSAPSCLIQFFLFDYNHRHFVRIMGVDSGSVEGGSFDVQFTLVESNDPYYETESLWEFPVSHKAYTETYVEFSFS